MLQPTSPSNVVKTAAAASAGRLLKPCPPSNKDFACDSIHSVEGEYTLLHDIHFDTIAPQFDSGTRASVVDVRPRAASSSTSSLEMSSASSKHQEDHVSWHKPTLTLEISRAQPIPIQGSHHHHPHQHHPHASSTQMLTPPRNTPTANHNNNNGANAALMPIMHPSSPTPTSSTPLSPPPMDHASSNGNNTTSSSPPPAPMPTMAPSVSSATATTLDASQHDFSSSFSSLFSRRNSVRFHNTPQRKPRNNLTKTKSSFVLKIVIHDRLASILANRTIDDGFLFFNVGTSFLWMDARGKPKDPLSRIVFSKAFPTCHDVNTVTKTNEHLDVIIGFSSGDIVWYDPLTSKYFRLNKAGIMKKEAVTAIKWIPGSEDLFMAAFADGTMMIMDKDREDQAFTPAIRTTWIEQQFHVTRPHKNAKYNPVSHWSVNDQGVSGFAFSPDGVYLAIVGLDGTLRIVNYMQERLLDVFASYYGNFLCVAWSPDGRYILTGGQDDLVTIWGMTEKRIVARCQGHKSWVTGVAFDPFRYDEGSLYRFGSVGEDCKLMLWDFSYSALHRPKHVRIAFREENRRFEGNDERINIAITPEAHETREARKSRTDFPLWARTRSNTGHRH
ncbi:WD40-repeat-containing domain protein [Gongronella butleri]|nr:WD40-repeat-containing domain protein [Gongronella butleri]